ncbi:hypothetical protein COLO4_34385 [Corchorus olitorius]|uniref:Enhancer of polycomb-like protein n=1 Tax=Corchorus olitorius TaxID=93759 RepID=A0A1R3GL24_9ROSI|nr:hypothetical protein COLO4_34385 [Corchorus olitorius]
MPSVGMRRTTRVFGMVKGSEGARVLRSGRRLWPDSGEVNTKTPTKEADEHYNLRKKPLKSEVNGAAPEVNGKPKRVLQVENPKKQTRKPKDAAINNGGRVDKMYGIVYTRKRKRNEVQKDQLSEQKTFERRNAVQRNHPSGKSNRKKKKVRRRVSRRQASKRRKTSKIVQEARVLTFTVENGDCYDAFKTKIGTAAVEIDRCYREEGTIVTLELSASREWLLVVKKDGSTKYAHKADKFMRPSSCNRFTHAIMWTGDENWKLEFPNPRDWIIFKDLYKECSERNTPASIVKVIPVPGVHEVSGYEDICIVPFHRPELYITFDGDEVSRALAKRKANYDMDSEDEEWLKKFNYEFFSGNGHCEHLSNDCFELMVDAFEKAHFCSPDDYANENAAAHLCRDLASRGVVEAVHAYWLKKRKQRRSALLRVFQGHQVKKAPVVPKPFLRKRRSFKRQASHGRGKHPSLLKALAAEHDALAEQNAMLKVEEARVSASRSVESAIAKRRRAQLLMENADMATYKAMMALRIAEAAQFIEFSDGAVSQFFDL